MAKKQKYYTVWKGRQTGVFDTWKEAEEQVKGFETAQYKSFESLKEAEDAFKGNYWQSVQKPQGVTAGKQIKSSTLVGKYNVESISVDAACAGNPGKLEYQGVETGTKRVLFSMGPFPQGTVNIGEFLAIVHVIVYSGAIMVLFLFFPS